MADDIEFGFNYQQWTKNTDVTLTTVKWNADYRDIVRMDSQAAFDTWIDNRPGNITVDKVSLQRFNYKQIRVNVPFNRALKYNYLRAVNDVSPDDISRSYYYFIVGHEQRNPSTTIFHLQLDVWATFGYEVTFGNCYLERGHMSIANTNQFQQYGRSYLTVPEGLDTGNEYRTVHFEFQRIMDIADSDNNQGCDILVCSTLDLTQDPGTSENPSIQASSGGAWQTMPTGADFYIFPTNYDFSTFMAKYSSKPWITQSIISITVIPNLRRYNPDYDYGDNIGDSTFKMYKASVGSGTVTRPNPKSVSNLTNWRNNDFIGHILGSVYAGLKKFLTFPYMVIELTTFTGSPVILRPESWQDPDAKITELAAFMPPGQRIVAYPARYNADAETLSSTQTDTILGDNAQPIHDLGEALNIAVTLDNFPSLPIVNDMAIAFLAQNRNGLAFSFQNAEWGRQRGLAAAAAGANVANAQIANTNTQAGIGITATQQSAALQQQMALERGLTGIGTSALAGSVGGMAGATAGALMNSQQANAQANIQNTARGASAGSDVATAASIRDTNLDYANFAAQGDYENNIRGTIAKIQDSALTQPSVSGQFGGDAFNLINGLFGYGLIWKMPNLSVLRQIGNHWLRYGYAANQFVTPPDDMRCMSKFTYWKLAQTYFDKASIPENFKQTIRGIFENGVTVWSNPDDIGVIDLADNDPLSGISY